MLLDTGVHTLMGLSMPRPMWTLGGKFIWQMRAPARLHGSVAPLPSLMRKVGYKFDGRCTCLPGALQMVLHSILQIHRSWAFMRMRNRAISMSMRLQQLRGATIYSTMRVWWTCFLVMPAGCFPTPGLLCERGLCSKAR